MSPAQQATIDFDGETYNREKDGRRLTTQLDRVHGLMRDGRWRTLTEIVDGISYPPYQRATEAGVSARLRDLRKKKFGGYVVNRRRRDRDSGLWEYQLVVPHD